MMVDMIKERMKNVLKKILAPNKALNLTKTQDQAGECP